MGNIEATGNLNVTFFDAMLLSPSFESCKQVAKIKNSCIAGWSLVLLFYEDGKE